MQRIWLRVTVNLLLLCCSLPAYAADNEAGRDLLEKNCSRCHALAAGTLSHSKKHRTFGSSCGRIRLKGWRLNWLKGSVRGTKTCRKFSFHQTTFIKLRATFLVIDKSCECFPGSSLGVAPIVRVTSRPVATALA